MRIIAGEFRSRRLEPPPGDAPTRPMPDRVREAIFSMLRGHVEGKAVLDCFAGSGPLGLEALSRGAANVVFVERDKSAAAALDRNIAMLGAADRCDVVVGDALGPSALNRAPRPLHLLIFDPPYALVLDPEQRTRVFAQLSRLIGMLDDDGFAVLRTPWPFVEPSERELSEMREAMRPRRRGGAGGRGSPRRGRARDGHDGAAVDLLDKNLRWRDGGAHDEEEAASHPDHPEDRAPRLPISLEVPGARGPESHVYGSMALHLYMKAR